MRIKNKHHLCKCLLPTLLSIWHGHNDGLTYSTCWNGVQISKLNSICNYCDDMRDFWSLLHHAGSLVVAGWMFQLWHGESLVVALKLLFEWDVGCSSLTRG